MEKNCQNCKHKNLDHREEPCWSCGKDHNMFEAKFQTNRQWLESLSDKEYAKQLWDSIKRTVCDYNQPCSFTGCAFCFVNWLQAEHKEQL